MDLSTTLNGDILSSNMGVVQLSVADSIGQRLDHILRSKPGDWARNPTFGAYLPQYIGYPNNPAKKSLIESELIEELENDRIIGAFPINVEYTPTTRNTGMVEISIKLPDGNLISIHREMNLQNSINTTEGLPYTPPRYNTSEIITKTELVTITTDSNTIEVSKLPINGNVFIVPYDDETVMDENGHLVVTGQNVYHQYDFVSGELPEHALTDRSYELTDDIRDVMINAMIDTITITVDDDIITNKDYRIDDTKLTIRNQYSETVDGTIEYYGLEQPPSGYVKIYIDYYDTLPIVSIDSFEQDVKPEELFPRSRIMNRNFITTKNIFEPGTYLVQYSTYALEV